MIWCCLIQLIHYFLLTAFLKSSKTDNLSKRDIKNCKQKLVRSFLLKGDIIYHNYLNFPAPTKSNWFLKNQHQNFQLYHRKLHSFSSIFFYNYQSNDICLKVAIHAQNILNIFHLSLNLHACPRKNNCKKVIVKSRSTWARLFHENNTNRKDSLYRRRFKSNLTF